MFLAMNRDWFGEAIYNLFNFISLLIYMAVSAISDGLMNIANSSLFNGVGPEFTKRIYLFVGIYMLFKLAFSLLNALVTPDKLTDNQTGMQAIVIRSITALSLLILVPGIFSEAMVLQGKILPVLPKVIIGRTVDSSGGLSYGENVASMAWGAFIQNNEECDSGNAETGLENAKLSSIFKHAGDPCSPNKTTVFKYDVNFLMAFVTGVLLAGILLIYCVDVAIRMIKMSILEVIAPIPIISYIDPKSSKDGAFSKWLSMSISVYADLFIKLSMFYLAIFILSEIGSNPDFLKMPENLDGISKGYVFAFIIIGTFMFMRQAPQFIGDMLGIKLQGNSFQGFAGIAAAAGFAGAAGGAIGGALAGGAIGAVAGFQNSQLLAKTQGRQGILDRARSIGAGLTGAIGGMARGGAGAVGKGNNFSKSMDNLRQRHQEQKTRAANGVSSFGHMLGNVTKPFVGRAEDARVKSLETAKSSIDNLKQAVGNEIDANTGFTTTYNGTSVNYADLKTNYELAKTRGATSFAIAGRNYSMAEASNELNTIKQSAINDYSNHVHSNRGSNTGADAKIEKLQDAAEVTLRLAGQNPMHGDINIATTNVNNAMNKITNSQGYKNRNT